MTLSKVVIDNLSEALKERGIDNTIHGYSNPYIIIRTVGIFVEGPHIMVSNVGTSNGFFNTVDLADPDYVDKVVNLLNKFNHIL